MPANGKEKELNQKYNAPLEIWLPILMHQYRTTYKVAVACGVYEGTVRWWLKKIGWQRTAAK